MKKQPLTKNGLPDKRYKTTEETVTKPEAPQDQSAEHRHFDVTKPAQEIWDEHITAFFKQHPNIELDYSVEKTRVVRIPGQGMAVVPSVSPVIVIKAKYV